MARVARWLLVLALVGCGRISIDPLADSGTDAPGDGVVADAPWSLVQTVGVLNSPNVAVARLGAHHLVVVAIQIDGGGQINAITDNLSCNTFVAIPAAHATTMALGDDLQIYYAEDSCPQADTISIATTMGAIHAVVIWEVAGIRIDGPVDTATVLDDRPRTGTPLGPAITTGGAGEFVVSIALVENNVTGTHAGNEFTNDQTTNGNGWAHLADPQAAAGPHQAQWDQMPSGAYCATAVAFRTGP
jgi:hypothetical protein